MRAVVFAAGKELTVAERPEPVPGPREVVIETAAVGICGTDVHVLDGEFEGTVFPLVPGHEATGTVVALGPGADEGPNALAVGDQPSFSSGLPLGQSQLGTRLFSAPLCSDGTFVRSFWIAEPSYL